MADNGTITNGSAIETVDKIHEDYVIWMLNKTELRHFVPTIIFLVILLVSGVTGNALVIYVYHVSFRRTPGNFFIQVLAIIDCNCCVFALTYEIFDLSFSVMNGEMISCKTFRYIESTHEVCSCLLLLCIAYDRYLQICQPAKTLSIQHAKRLVLACVISTIVLCAPSGLTFGVKTFIVKNITVTGCSFNYLEQNSIIPFIYYIVLGIVLIVDTVCVYLCYAKIASAIFTWKKMPQRSTLRQRNSVSTLRHMSSRHDSTTLRSFERFSTSDAVGKITIAVCGKALQQYVNETSVAQRRASSDEIGTSGAVSFQTGKRRTIAKSVSILFVVTLVFTISFMPYVTEQVLLVTNLVNIRELSDTERSVWEISNKSYFLSNSLNPLIYATFNKTFRKKCYRVLFARNTGRPRA